MGKIKHNLRLHSRSLQPLKMVKKLPDLKRFKTVDNLAAGLKGKMKRPKYKKSAKKKAWTSETRVTCEWCPKDFSR